MQQLFKTIYWSQLAKIKKDIPFFHWLNDNLKETKIPIPNYNPSDCVTKRQAKL